MYVRNRAAIGRLLKTREGLGARVEKLNLLPTIMTKTPRKLRMFYRKVVRGQVSARHQRVKSVPRPRILLRNEHRNNRNDKDRNFANRSAL